MNDDVSDDDDDDDGTAAGSMRRQWTDCRVTSTLWSARRLS